MGSGAQNNVLSRDILVVEPNMMYGVGMYG